MVGNRSTLYLVINMNKQTTESAVSTQLIDGRQLTIMNSGYGHDAQPWVKVILPPVEFVLLNERDVNDLSNMLKGAALAAFSMHKDPKSLS